MFAASTAYLHTDQAYLLFAGIALALWLVVDVALRRLVQGARLPWVAWMLVGAILLGGWAYARNACEQARADICRLVSFLAPTYAGELALMGHEEITPATNPADPRYLAMIEACRRWEQANPYAHDIYTIRKLADGRKVFIVDAETDYNQDGRLDAPNETRTPIGQEFTGTDEGLDIALSGHANFDEKIIQDEWGCWVGSWAPIVINGKVDGVVGVDYDAHRWINAIESAHHDVLQRLGLLLLTAGIGSIAFALQRADLSRRSHVEARSRYAEERMLLTVRKLPLGFIEWNASAQVVAWNPSAERIFGFTEQEMLGTTAFPILVAAGSHEHVDKIWSGLMKQTGGTHSINDNVTKDGRRIICEWFNTPLIGSDGKVTGVFSLMQDITERVNLEKHVQQGQRLGAVGQLAAGVAHDFNNILTIITGHAGLLLTREDLPREALTELERIEEAGLRAAGLTRQLLAFSRQQAMFSRPLHLNEVVESTTTMLSRVLGADLTLNVRLDDQTLAIEADPAMMDQIVTNLVLNARDALPHGGSIAVAVERVEIPPEAVQRDPDAQPGPAVCLSVSDTGVGIPPDQLARIFEPFFTTKQTGKGTGLGLSVVHGIVKQHHGWIEVQSAPGGGTTFRIYFPPTDKPLLIEKAEPASSRRKLACPQRKTILVVEDEVIVRDLARMILERAGYRVLIAEDGPSALRLWARQGREVDLLLTDMVMPAGLSGRDLSLRLLADRPDLPVIYASGYSMELTAPDFQPNGRQIFLQKPYLADQLVSSVQRCLQPELEPSFA